MPKEKRSVVSHAEWSAAYSQEEKDNMEQRCSMPPWTGLRFSLEQRVMYSAGAQTRRVLDVDVQSSSAASWESGRIVTCWVKVYAPARSRRQLSTTRREGEEGELGSKHRWAPYQILLDSGSMAVALRDDERWVRKVEQGEASSARKKHLLSVLEGAPRLLAVGRQLAAEGAKETQKVEHMLGDLGSISQGMASHVEERPEDWHASVLRSEIREDLWKMFKLASLDAPLDLAAAMPIFRAVEPGITQAEIERKFAEMDLDTDGGGGIAFDSLQRLWWSCLLEGRELAELDGTAHTIDQAISSDALQDAAEKLTGAVEGVKLWRSQRAGTAISSSMLTAVFRGRLVKSLKKQHDAAIFVQTRWRKHSMRRNFRNLRRCCIIVQRSYQQSRFMRRFRNTKQQVELVKQWSCRCIDVMSMLPPLISVSQSESVEACDSTDGSLFLKGCFSEGISVEQYEKSQKLLRSEEELRALFAGFAKICKIRRYSTTERWHEATASGKCSGRWPLGAAAGVEQAGGTISAHQNDMNALADARLHDAARECYALVCFHDPSMADMALSDTGQQLAARHGLRFSPVVAEWTVPREPGYSLAARDTRHHLMQVLKEQEKAKRRKRQTHLEHMAARARLTESASPVSSATGVGQPTSARTPAASSLHAVGVSVAGPTAHMDAASEGRAAVAAWWTSVIAVHTGVLATSAHPMLPGRVQGGGRAAVDVADVERSTPYAAIQREMAAATKRLRGQRMGRSRKPINATPHREGHGGVKQHSVDAAMVVAAAVLGGGSEHRKSNESERHRPSSRFTAMEAQPAGQLLPQWAEPGKLEAARTKQAHQQATLATLAATGCGPAAASASGSSGALHIDNMHDSTDHTRLQVYLKAEAMAAELMMTAEGSIAKTKLGKGRSQHQSLHQQQQQLASSLSLALWLRGINAPAECFHLLNAAGVRSLDDLLVAQLTEPQLMHMGFTQMKKRKDALKLIAAMSQQRAAQKQPLERPGPKRAVDSPGPEDRRKGSSSHKALQSRRIVTNVGRADEAIFTGWTSRRPDTLRRPVPPRAKHNDNKQRATNSVAGARTASARGKSNAAKRCEMAGDKQRFSRDRRPASAPGARTVRSVRVRPQRGVALVSPKEPTPVEPEVENLEELYTRVDDISWVKPMSTPR